MTRRKLRPGTLKAKCLAAIRAAGKRGLTTAEVEEAVGREHWHRPLDPRMSELKEDGLIMAGGKKRKGRAGTPVFVWFPAHKPPADQC